MCWRRQNPNSQECINRNVDYLNERQHHETDQWIGDDISIL